MNKKAPIIILLFVLLGIQHFYAPNFLYGAPSKIVSAEYFVDEDPGEGKGIKLDAKDGAFDSPKEAVEFSIKTTDLKIGIHNIYIRMQNEHLTWGTPRKIMFEVVGDKSIVAAEYFIGNPCTQIGISMPATDGNFDEAVEPVIADVDTSNLSLGLHTVWVRMKDSENHWGICRGLKFEIREPSYILGAEYYLDNDPGRGLGEPMACKDGICNGTIEQIEAKFRPWCQSPKIHTLFARAVDSYHRWSDPASSLIDIKETPANACPGDFKDDGDTDGSDLNIFKKYYADSDCSTEYICNGDLNCDNKISASDLSDFAGDFGRKNCP
jgi:hypothetical protein